MTAHADADEQTQTDPTPRHYRAGTTATVGGGVRTVALEATAEGATVHAGDVVFADGHSEGYRFLGLVVNQTAAGRTHTWVDLLGLESHAIRSVREHDLRLEAPISASRMAAIAAAEATEGAEDPVGDGDARESAEDFDAYLERTG